MSLQFVFEYVLFFISDSFSHRPLLTYVAYSIVSRSSDAVRLMFRNLAPFFSPSPKSAPRPIARQACITSLPHARATGVDLLPREQSQDDEEVVHDKCANSDPMRTKSMCCGNYL